MGLFKVLLKELSQAGKPDHPGFCIGKCAMIKIPKQRLSLEAGLVEQLFYLETEEAVEAGSQFVN
jgi:hypothetical protein